MSTPIYEQPAELPPARPRVYAPSDLICPLWAGHRPNLDDLGEEKRHDDGQGD